MKRARGRRLSRDVPASGTRLRLAAILLAGALTYSNSLSGPFIFDDRDSVLDNASIQDWRDIETVLSPPTETSVAGRPLVNATFAINYAFGGLEVRGYHIVNVGIHLLCALLVFAIVQRTLQALGPDTGLGHRSADLAFASALIWTVHPLNSEVVNYLTQRSESLLALFYLLTLFASIRATHSSRQWRWETVAIVSCALGMACKESMVTAPLMIVVYDRVFVFDSLKKAVRTRWRLYTGLAATWVLLAALMATAPRTLSAGFSAPDAAPWTYLLNQTVLISRYLLLAIWPRSLALYYGWPLPLTLGDVWPYALLMIVLLALTVMALFRWPKCGFLGVWFFVTLAPTSSIVPIATEVGAERRMYLPLMALVVLGVIGGAHVWTLLKRSWLARARSERAGSRLPRARPDAFVILIAAFATLLAARTVARNGEYASSMTLAETTLERWPTPAAHSMFGTELAAAGRFAEAESHLRTATPDYPPARYYLGSVLASVGKSNEAISQFQEFIRLQPPALDQVLLARGLLGGLFMKDRRWPEAIEQYQLILATAPADVDARASLATALVRQQSFEEAIEHYRVVVGARPGDVAALGGLGIALASTGKLDEAIPLFRRAVEVDPRNSHARQNLVKALLSAGNLAGAAAEAEQAVALAPDDPAAHELFGGILATQGRFVEARREFERALQIDSASPARDLLRKLAGRE
ncbi:MAG TPA: tetratricopeptide repeat protein [Vicinamibacterales bacterium]|nr:tetratricopeptide repeat protein [Vicinamibacterales bacterium]